jgi:hypothetical protein
MRQLKAIIFICSFCIYSVSGFSQYYDGGLDFTGKLGYEPGKNSYLFAGGEVGLSKLFSIGLQFKYLATVDKSSYKSPRFEEDLVPFNWASRLDLHGFYLFNMKKSDVLVGLNYAPSTFGTHAEMRYFFSEFFGVFGRTLYHFNNPNLSMQNGELLNSQLRFEVGILFKPTSGKSYDVKW